ncbi:hypothetical protein [Agriterribacter sp.]|uniref:hypothetical protein n=1 Tax=Agriterribacter sp. TaxID=2821509 RepID=UPI002C521EAD|nr:hypothetical protein [Agriterribacter sp.]HRO47545.1 hypothetical protein [Agriterribacter sp.]HRQ16996.1 hypothetical protein [Agriterribacter sp.]
MKKINWLVIALSLMATGCSTTRITSSWKAENIIPQQYNKIMVLGLIRESDRSLQEKMEAHLAEDLKRLGYNAVSSLEEYGPKAFDKMDEDAALEKLKDSGIDAVITIVLLDKEKERKYVAGNIYYSPYGYYYNRFWGYRGVLYHRIYEPGYYITNTKYFWESNLYDMGNQKLVYSAQTQSFDPENSESMAHEYGRMILKNMIKENVLEDRIIPTGKAF